MQIICCLLHDKFMKIMIAGNNEEMNSQIADMLCGYGVSDKAIDCDSAVGSFRMALESKDPYHLIVICCDLPASEITHQLFLIRQLEISHSCGMRNSTICIVSMQKDNGLLHSELHLDQDPDLYCLTTPLNLQELLIVARLAKSRHALGEHNAVFSSYSSVSSYSQMLADVADSKQPGNPGHMLSLIL